MSIGHLPWDRPPETVKTVAEELRRQAAALIGQAEVLEAVIEPMWAVERAANTAHAPEIRPLRPVGPKVAPVCADCGTPALTSRSGMRSWCPNSPDHRVAAV